VRKNDLSEKAIQTNSSLLPGGSKQLEHLLEQNIPKGEQALIIGSNCESIAAKLIEYFTKLFIITDDYESVMQIRMKLKDESKVKVKLMDYAHTDFQDKSFDLIYAQGSISVPDKNDILKEFKRIITGKGLFSAGEIVSLKEPVPGFVSDIWERSGLEPMAASEIKKYYEGRGFEVLSERDLSTTLKDFYEGTISAVSKTGKAEKEEDKKYFSRMKHESSAYLRLGGDKYIGFKSLILRKLN
jgi:ubiquinone/menaquinone biosynthesis C-methylase UbiE